MLLNELPFDTIWPYEGHKIPLNLLEVTQYTETFGHKPGVDSVPGQEQDKVQV